MSRGRRAARGPRKAAGTTAPGMQRAASARVGNPGTPRCVPGVVVAAEPCPRAPDALSGEGVTAARGCLAAGSASVPSDPVCALKINK